MKNFYLFFVLLGLLFSCGNKEEDVIKTSVDNILLSAENETEASQKIIKIDSAYNLLTQRQNDSVTRTLYRRCIASYYNLSLYNKTIKASNRTIDIADKAGDSLTLGKAYCFKGLAYYGLNIQDSALVNYKKAERIYDLMGHPDLGPTILYKAYIFFNVGEYVLAESEAFLALEKINPTQSSKVFECYLVIASSLNEQDNTDEAIYYYQKALNQLEVLKNHDSPENINMYRISCYNSIGLMYAKKRQYKRAIAEYNKVFDTDVLPRKSYWGGRIMNNLAQAKLLSGDKQGVKDMFYEALKISDSLDNKSEVVSCNLNLGSYYATVKDTANALLHYADAHNVAQNIKSNSDRLAALKGLIKLDVRNGINYSKEYIRLNDSLQRVSLENRNKYARIEYETDQLKESNDALLRRNSFIIGASVVVLLFVAAIFIIYYLNSRNKELMMAQEQQKANEEIYELMFEQQEKIETARNDEKNRIAMELHDGILNNIYAVRLNLEFTNRKSDDETVLKRKGYIKELQGLEAEIRSVSHDLSRSAKLVEGKDFGVMIEFLVTSQKNNFETFFEAHIDKDINWDEISNTVKVNIYRIVQEALQNINKYSQAKIAVVSISKIEDDQLLVIVKDDGVGFDIKKASTGIGLKNLRKRSEALDGLLEINSERGNGSQIKVQFTL